MKLRYFILLYLFMLAALPYPEQLAAGKNYPAWHCLIYMFGHAGILHYLLNGIGWLMMWKIATWPRTIIAWLVAALSVYILMPDKAVLGWSSVIYFYLGMTLAHAGRQRKISLILLTLTGMFIPGIAAALHLSTLAAGWIYRKIERRWEMTY